ncbi:MAG: hypothetical protein PHE88_03265 [Elusimicrobia bacterium]|nr:hypothetical protein [Elusimicrobiota bacterium]
MICTLLFPFDMGLDLDFKKEGTNSFYKTLHSEKISSLNFFDDRYEEIDVESRIYRFGCGLIAISFKIDKNIQACTQIANLSSQIKINDTDITTYCRKIADDIIMKAQQFATHKYDSKFKDVEIFPIFTMDKLSVSADSFITKNLKTLYGIVSSETNYEKLSEFVIRQEPLANYGYYEDEIILIKRFGAFISSQESDTIKDIIKLVLVQWWVLKSYDYILETELDEAQKHLTDIPSGWKILKTFTQYNHFSKDSLDFNRDKLEIVSSIHTSFPEIENDWHLKTLYTNINKIFNTDELYKWVEIKITRIEDSYDNARDFLSTNFFILLDVIFFLSLAWSIFDTILLWKISAK